MDIKKLKQYRSLKKEIVRLEKTIDRMRDQLNRVPTVMGKVQASDHDFPYTRISVPVEMLDPKEVAVIRQRLAIKEKRQRKVQRLIIEIEQYIASIEDSENRQIFEMAFVDGMTYRAIGEQLNMDFTTVSKRITKQLSTNSTK